MPLGNHTLLLSLEGGLWAFGRNSDGQLGLGHKNDQRTPAEVPWNGPQPVQVDWGWNYSLVLDAEGGVWQAGRSWWSTDSILIFQKVRELPSITLVAVGYSHSAAIDTEGGLWVWTSKEDLSWASSLPQRVEGVPPLVKVACGCNFLVAEAEEGLWVLGENSQGQLGLGHTNDALKPTHLPVTTRSEGPFRCLAALEEGVVAIDSQGGVFSAGANFYGQLGRTSGDVTKLQRIMNIPFMLAASCGCCHTLSLDENGGVWSWGCGRTGQLGTGNTSNQSQPSLVPSLEGISALVAGADHSLAFPQEGGLLVFGLNGFGELGLNHAEIELSPMLCPIQPALPLLANSSKKKSARFL